MAVKGRLTVDDVRRYVEDTGPTDPPAMPPAPGERPENPGVPMMLVPPDFPEPEPESGSKPPYVAPPVDGVSDQFAWWLSSRDEGPTLMLDPNDERSLPWVKDYLSNTDEHLAADKPATDEEAQYVLDNLLGVVNRGRVIAQRFPTAFDGWTPNTLSKYLRGDYNVENPWLSPAQGRYMLQDERDAEAMYQDIEENTAWAVQPRSTVPEKKKPPLVPDRTSVTSRSYHEANPNPPFAAVRGGPATPFALMQGGSRPVDALANYLETSGASPDIVERYRTDPVRFTPRIGRFAGNVGAMTPEDKRGGGALGILLSDFLTNPNEEDVVQAASHEGLHRYDQVNKITNTPYFHEGVAMAMNEYPDMVNYMRAVPLNDPSYFGHVYTAALDQGLTMDEIPPPLRQFYVDAQGQSLLNSNPPYQLSRRQQNGNFIGPIPRARMMDVLMGGAR